MPQDDETAYSGQKLLEPVAFGAIALGSNLSIGGKTPRDVLNSALMQLDCDGFSIRTVSRFFATPAFPMGSGPDFVNACASFETNWSADAVLEHLHATEKTFARRRAERWAPRTLDLDLLFLEDQILPDRDTLETWMSLPAELQGQTAPKGIILPHPRLHERAFVLVPLNDVAPNWRHPGNGLTVQEMKSSLPNYLMQDVVAL